MKRHIIYQISKGAFVQRFCVAHYITKDAIEKGRIETVVTRNPDNATEFPDGDSVHTNSVEWLDQTFHVLFDGVGGHTESLSPFIPDDFVQLEYDDHYELP